MFFAVEIMFFAVEIMFKTECRFSDSKARDTLIILTSFLILSILLLFKWLYSC